MGHLLGMLLLLLKYPILVLLSSQAQSIDSSICSCLLGLEVSCAFLQQANLVGDILSLLGGFVDPADELSEPSLFSIFFFRFAKAFVPQRAQSETVAVGFLGGFCLDSIRTVSVLCCVLTACETVALLHVRVRLQTPHLHHPD